MDDAVRVVAIEVLYGPLHGLSLRASCTRVSRLSRKKEH